MMRYSAGKTNARRLPMRGALAFGILVAIAVGLVVSPPDVEAATISSFSCGDTIVGNVLLTGDVVCPASFDAAPTSGRGAIIGASNIVIDGNGHTFDYSAAAGVSFGLPRIHRRRASG